MEETDGDSVPLLHTVGLPVGEALTDTLCDCDSESVPELHTVAEAVAQEVADTLKLLLCVPVAHCVPDTLTDTLAEGDRDSDGVAVTHVDTDTVEDGVCDSVVVRDVV